LAIKIDLIKLVQRSFLFAQLSKDDLLALEPHLAFLNVKKNHYIFQQGDSAEKFFLILNGKVTVSRLSKSGPTQTLHVLGDGDLLAEAAIFNDMCYPGTAKCLTDASLIAIEKKAFLSLLTSKPDVALRMLSAYAMKLREFVSMIEYLSLDDIKLRLLKYIQKNHFYIDGAPIFKISIKKKELAALIGTAPETLSRTLKKLKDEEYLKIVKEGFQVLKFE